MSTRDDILARIRQAQPSPEKRQPRPDYDDELIRSKPRLAGNDLWEIFARNFTAVNGRVMTEPAVLSAFLRERGFTTGYCDPALMDQLGKLLQKDGLTVETTFDRSRYDDIQFGITRATGAIAESGSLILDDHRTSDRLAALSPWVHVGVLRRSEVIRSIPDAIAAFDSCPNIIWATGPSKTADVEGILIEGVHGPGEEIAFLLEAATG